MKSLLLLLLIFTVPVVVAQTIVDAPLIESTPTLTLTPHETAAAPAVVSEHGVVDAPALSTCCDCGASHSATETECCGCANCGCGSCCHVGGCGDGNACGSDCQGMCCNNVSFDEAGNLVHTDGTSGEVVLDGSATPVGTDGYSSGTSVRGFGGGGGSGISAFSGGWGLGFGAVGGGGGGGGGRRAAAFAGFGARGFRNQPSLSASN